MSDNLGYLENTAVRQIGVVASVALLCMVLSTAALSQTYDDAEGQDQAVSAEDFDRFEAERRRQQMVQFENERRRQERVRLENERLRLERERREQQRLRLDNERLRQEQERREQENLRLENERLRLENEHHELAQLRLEKEAREWQRAQTVVIATRAQASDSSDDADIYEQLRALGQLKDDGILTEEEFQRLKQKILQ